MAPSHNRLHSPRPPPPNTHIPFHIVSGCLCEMDFDPAKLISDDSSSDHDNEDIDFNQGTNLGTLKKSMFSLVDAIFLI